MEDPVEIAKKMIEGLAEQVGLDFQAAYELGRSSRGLPAEPTKRLRDDLHGVVDWLVSRLAAERRTEVAMEAYRAGQAAMREHQIGVLVQRIKDEVSSVEEHEMLSSLLGELVSMVGDPLGIRSTTADELQKVAYPAGTVRS